MSTDDIHLHLVSGFRSVAEQEALYFGVKAARVQSARERARVSAPPGYSEHHSGYALDISDEALSLDASFAQSPAYRWLQENARGYNFELSFPEDGAVAFEPWHWRYGSKRSTAQVLAKLHATIQRAERPERRFLECIGRLPCVDAKAHAERHEDGEDVRDSLAKQPREQLCCVCGC